MKVVITGATGLIGRRLADTLVSKGHKVFALTRNKRKASQLLASDVSVLRWNDAGDVEWKAAVSGADAVVNLAGENLSSGRWTQKKKEALLASRLGAIRSIGGALEQSSGKKCTLVEASAVGFYGPHGEEQLTEKDPSGSGYLAEIASQCEREAEKLTGSAARVVSIRTGVVLAIEGGILPRLFTPVRFGFGGYPGTGEQWLSWIHLDDEVGAIEFLLERDDLTGPFNLTAPDALTMREFVKLGGQLLHRPIWFPLPATILRLAFGEMADEALLTGQRVLPARLIEAGYTFRYPNARAALSALIPGGAKRG